MKRNQPYSRKLRQFKSIARKINKLMAQGKFQRLTKASQERLTERLRRAYTVLKARFSGVALRKIMAGAAVVLGMGLTQTVQGQAMFDPPVDNPFNLMSVYGYAFPEFVDLDNDGDFDALIGDYDNAQGVYFENTGTAQFPSFAAPVNNPFGMSSTNQEFHPRFVDLDGDGDQDLFVGEYGGDMIYFQNTGTATAPFFGNGGQRNPFNLQPCNQQAWLTFGDLDGDGDMDMLAGENGGKFQYIENIGTATAPDFTSSIPNGFGLNSTQVSCMPYLIDIDGDGDLDIFASEDGGNVLYFENTGTSTVPAFAAPLQNPMGINAGYGIAYPAFVDIDADGDMDLFLGEQYGINQFQENQIIVAADNGVEAFEDVTVFPNPTANTFTVSVNSTKGLKNVEVELYDPIGRVISTQNLGKRIGLMEVEMDLSEYARGTYLVRVRTGDEMIVKRVVRE
ncbi:MAG: T9SS type A sorting domain-containing protein [Bacteroidota bacterium]